MISIALAGCGDANDLLDTDGDGVADVDDICPAVADPLQLDEDGDGAGDACQCDARGGDTDGDRVCDGDDNCPTAFNLNQQDLDGDGVGDVCDPTPSASDPGVCAGRGGDRDGDEWCGVDDNCPNVANPDQSDVDGNGVGDVCDDDPCDELDNDADGSIDEDGPDADGDGVSDCTDVCPGSPDVDSDGDGLPDCVDPCVDDPANTNTDGDGWCDDVDNCPTVSNNQADRDGDGVGDRCAIERCDGISNDEDARIDEGLPDEDGDGLCDELDPCLGDPGNDADGDGICHADDNCPDDPNPDQADVESDGSGDACDLDTTCGSPVPLLATGAFPFPADLSPVDVAEDRARALVYVTVNRTSPVLPNQLVALDPSTSSVAWHLQLPAEPSWVVLTDDGGRLYVGFRDASWVQVVDPERRAACGSFTSGISASPSLATTIPGRPELLLTLERGTRFLGSGTLVLYREGRPLPEHGSVRLYDWTPPLLGAVDSSRAVVGGDGLQSLELDTRGVGAATDLSSSTFSGFATAGDLIYTFDGPIIDVGPPVSVRGVLPERGPLVVVPSIERVFTATATELVVTDDRTLLVLGRTPYPTGFGEVTKMVRAGSDGLVLLGSAAGQAHMLVMSGVVVP